MKLIIEKYADGSLYAYRENKRHHKVVEQTRKRASKKLDPKVLDKECDLSYLEPGSYMVFNLKKE